MISKIFISVLFKTHLNHSNVQNNGLRGTLPLLPDSLLGLYLNLNDIGGTIQAFPPKLEKLYLSSNRFQGSLPLLPASLIDM